MKRKTNILALSFLSIATLFAAISSSLAWFKNGSDVAFGNGETIYLHGGTEAFYFGKGDGTIDNPYEISTRNQLYNLAWLQYTGYFNTKTVTNSDGTTSLVEDIQQPYIILKNNIDMQGITLPPIGTETYPFYGNFDGNGKTISNLTVSNDNPNSTDSDFGVMKPASIPDHAKQPNIVGFFGVVGKLPNVNADYDSTINEAKNFTLLNIKVQNRTPTLLIGLAAGYMDGLMSGVKVDGDSDIIINKVSGNNPTAITTISKKISEYGLVGFTTKPGSSGTYKQNISRYYDSEDDDDGTGDDWGGSIDMHSLYTRLKSFDGTTATPPNPTTSNGTADPGTSKMTTVSTPTTYNESFLDGDADEEDIQNSNIRTYTKNTGTDFMGNFKHGDYWWNKIYLVGGHYINNIYYLSDTDVGVSISSGTNHFLTTNTGYSNVRDVTSKNDSCVWHIENGLIYTTRYTYNHLSQTKTNYYLYNNRGSLALTDRQTTANGVPWTVTENNGNQVIKSTYNNNQYRLVYNNGWTLVNVSAVSYYTIETTSGSSTYYFSNSRTGSSNPYTPGEATTDIDSAAHLNVNNTGVYYTVGTTNYYLVLYRTSNNSTTYNFRLRTSTQNNNQYVYFRYSNGNLTATTSGRPSATYYLHLSGTSWTATTSSSSALSLTSHYQYDDNSFQIATQSHSVDTKKYDDPETSGHMEFSSSDTSYMPINAYKEDQKEGDVVVAKQYEPTSKNTGYIVGGTTSATYASNSRSMVISCYDRSTKIGKSLDTDNCTILDNKVRTVTQKSGDTEPKVYTLDKTNLKKYDDIKDPNTNEVISVGSKTKLQNVFINNVDEDGEDLNQVSGLHFTNANSNRTFMIRKENVVDATNVKVGGREYSGDNTYQLPVYSIDFNLKQQGYINFFAGSYNGGSGAGQTGDTKINAFFSLHRVFRDSSNKISDIKEIKAIYTKSGSTQYYYSYKKYKNADNDYDIDPDSDVTSTTENQYTKVFDTDWLGFMNRKLQQTDSLGHLYYFEIPVDSGEYCLGNVCHGTDVPEGCYLIYLDIGASGNQDTDHITAYTITTIADPITFPTGVDFAIAGIDGNGGNTICVFIPANTSGHILFGVNTDETNTDENIYVTDALSNHSTYSYVSNLANADDGFELASPAEQVPKPMVTSPPGYTRISYICVEPASSTTVKYYITIVDKFVYDETTEAYKLDSSTYILGGNEVGLNDLISSGPQLSSSAIATIRALTLAVSLERVGTNVTQTFDAILPQLPWTNSETTYIITLQIPEGYVVKVDAIAGYTVIINTHTVHEGGTSAYSGQYTEPTQTANP